MLYLLIILLSIQGGPKRKKKPKQSIPHTLILVVVPIVVILVAVVATWIYSSSLDANSDSTIVLDRPSEIGGMPLGPPLQSNHTDRQEAVVSAFKHAWRAYKAHAWGKDELKPISKDSNEWFNLGLTLVDSLDTMWLMGLTEEFFEARKWVETEMVIAQDKDVNLFETTIRVMGGLLSTYHLTQDQLFLDRAVSSLTFHYVIMSLRIVCLPALCHLHGVDRFHIVFVHGVHQVQK